MPTYELTYFNIEGAAEKLRLAFKLAGVEFKDTRVNFPDWPALKPTTPAGTLPILKIDDKTVTQSGGILRYIGHKYNIAPADALRGDEIDGIIDDIGRALAPGMIAAMRPAAIGFEGTPEEAQALSKKLYAAAAQPDSSLVASLKYLDTLLGQNDSGFAVGDSASIIDCALLPTIRRFRSGALVGIPADFVDQFPNIVRAEKTISAVPAIKAHYA